jgi:hypothetical protein
MLQAFAKRQVPNIGLQRKANNSVGDYQYVTKLQY